jgi:hypothetical protein
MKQKRNNVVVTNNNNQQSMPQQQRDGSNDPYENAVQNNNYGQRIDTGGGDYM